MTIRAIFRKHFTDGEGDDYPTDNFRPSAELAATFVEMRAPATGEYGEEEWIYETDDPDAIEADLDRCETCISYERMGSGADKPESAGCYSHRNAPVSTCGDCIRAEIIE